MRALGYTRVSSQEQLNGTSLTEQARQIRAFCEMKSIELLAIYTDGAVSGGKALKDRPQGSLMLQSLADGEADTVIICKLDRGFRSASDCLANVEAWEKENVSLVILNLGGQTIDTSSAAGKFFITVMAGAAELEKNLIKERCNSGRAARKAENKRIGEIPYGFNLAHDNTLIPKADEQKGIDLIISLHEQGYSLRNIASMLNESGLAPKKGKIWTHGMVQSLLKRIA